MLHRSTRILQIYVLKCIPNLNKTYMSTICKLIFHVFWKNFIRIIFLKLPSLFAFFAFVNLTFQFEWEKMKELVFSLRSYVWKQKKKAKYGLKVVLRVLNRPCNLYQCVTIKRNTECRVKATWFPEHLLPLSSGTGPEGPGINPIPEPENSGSGWKTARAWAVLWLCIKPLGEKLLCIAGIP